MSKIKRKKKAPQLTDREQKRLRWKQIGALAVAIFIIITLILPMVASSTGF